MSKITNAMIDKAVALAIETDGQIEKARSAFATIKEVYDAAIASGDKEGANKIRRDVQMRYASVKGKKSYDVVMEQYKLKGTEQAEWFVKAYGAARTAWSRYVNYTKKGGGSTPATPAKAAPFADEFKDIMKALAKATPKQAKALATDVAKLMDHMRQLGLIESDE